MLLAACSHTPAAVAYAAGELRANYQLFAQVLRRDRNESKSGLASPTFFLSDLEKFLKLLIFPGFCLKKLTSGNYLGFPGLPANVITY